VLVRKSRRALLREGLRDLLICGGVAANRGLRTALAAAAEEDGFRLFVPTPKLCTDNGAMIAQAAPGACARRASGLDLSVDPGCPCEGRSAGARTVSVDARDLSAPRAARQEIVGQNFLVDARVQERIVAAAALSHDDVWSRSEPDWARSQDGSSRTRSNHRHRA